jgi:hypothetical protein
MNNIERLSDVLLKTKKATKVVTKKVEEKKNKKETKNEKINEDLLRARPIDEEVSVISTKSDEDRKAFLVQYKTVEAPEGYSIALQIVVNGTPLEDILIAMKPKPAEDELYSSFDRIIKFYLLNKGEKVLHSSSPWEIKEYIDEFILRKLK